MSRSRMFGDQPPEQAEIPSPRTTIVGGRPPEPNQCLPPIPTGIQDLLRLGAVDPDFRRELVESRGAVAPAAGVSLTASEQAVLQAVPASQLEAMIEHLPPSPPDRRGFLREVAASAVTALGGAALVSVESCRKSSPVFAGGARPDPPPPRPQHRETQSEGGARAVEPEPKRPEHRPEAPGGANPDVPPPVTRGIRPDVPPKKKKDQGDTGKPKK